MLRVFMATPQNIPAIFKRRNEVFTPMTGKKTYAPDPKPTKIKKPKKGKK
jgi:hypothetical protein